MPDNLDKTKRLIIVQARVSSTRLPGKVLLDLVGESLLIKMIERVSLKKTVADIIVATTTEESDNPIVDLCDSVGINSYRGHPVDLLDRHYHAALHYGASVIAKIPSDCPLIDPSIIDKVFDKYLKGGCDYASNLHPASFPDGNDVEVMSLQTLKKAWQYAKLPFEREHTTPYIWERPNEFRLSNVEWGDGKKSSNYSMTHRWTIDYPDDYEFVKRVYQELYENKKDFDLKDIIDLIEKKPEIHEINSKYAGVNWYRNHLDMLKTISPSETRVI